MRTTTAKTTAKKKPAKDKKKRKKRTALVICKDRKQFWTTQAQFWQWVREAVVIKTSDAPLTGMFVRENEELMVVLSNTVLNLARPNHLREAMLSRRIATGWKRTGGLRTSK
ncbi:MAG: hypothetical protein ND895_27250 [Pyrinomonadaceae bacterium]|nr:hypothetical protein [Pyrinomonadaceae bacterium]